MNDMLIQMVASQLGIPASVLAELKATKPQLVGAEFNPDGKSPTLVVLTLEVASPQGTFPVVLTLPSEQLKRIPVIYEKAVKLAFKN